LSGPGQEEVEEHIVVHVKYGEHEQTFRGPVEEVWKAVNKFFSDIIPIFRLIRKATVTLDLTDLVEEFKDLVCVCNGDVIPLLDREELSDRDTIMLCLIGAYIGYRLGSLPKETLSSGELKEKLRKTAKITSTRLSELRREGWVERTEGGEYRVTPLGLMRFREKRLPKLMAKARSRAR